MCEQRILTGIMKINEAWRSYRDDVVPKSASMVQMEETHKAFYAGYGMALEELTRMSAMDDDTAVLALDTIHKEMGMWLEQVANSGKRN